MSQCTGVALPTELEIVVYGSPAPQGSKRHVGGGRMIESSAALRPWREAVKAAARALIEPWEPEWRPWDGPIRVRAVFTLRKPLSAPKRRRTYPVGKPDVSKLARSTEDALTDAGVWRDDARVIEYERLAKVFPGEDPEALTSPGVRLLIRRVE
jgi:Holliday junction resolvase RusA-like endonuclease